MKYRVTYVVLNGDPQSLTVRARRALDQADIVVQPEDAVPSEALGEEPVSQGPLAIDHPGLRRIVRLTRSDPRMSSALVTEANTLRDRGAEIELLPFVTWRDIRLAEAGLSPDEAARVVVRRERRGRPASSPFSSEHRPLFGVRTLVGRPRDQVEATVQALVDRGAVPIVVPLVSLHPPSDPALAIQALTQLATYDAVVFTSRNGVAAFGKLLDDFQLDARTLAGKILAAIGPGTAESLRLLGLRADLTAPEHRGESLAAELNLALHDQLQKGSRTCAKVLLPRAEVARDVLPERIREAGHTIDVVPVYRSLPISGAESESLKKRFEHREIDAVLLTASSTVDALVEALGSPQLLEGVVIASIGPITTARCKTHGFGVDVEASPYTLPALLNALETIVT